MNKLISITVSALLLLWLSASVSLYAKEETVDKQEVITEKAMETEDEGPISAQESKIFKGFMFKYQIDDTHLPTKTVSANPTTLVYTLDGDMLGQIAQQDKPFTMKTEITGVWAESLADSWGKLPPFTMTTTVDKAGKGKTKLDLPAFKKQLPDFSDEKNKIAVDWKGLQGQSIFTTGTCADMKCFSGVESDLTMQGLLLRFGEKNDSFDVGKLTVKGEVRTEQGIQLETSNLKIDQMQITKDKATTTIKGVTVKGESVLKEAGITSKFEGTVNQLLIPKEAIDNLMDIDLSYEVGLELRRLDTEAFKQFQQTVRNLQAQFHKGKITEEMVGLSWFAKLTELAPALLAKSPELALTQLNLKMEEGQLTGKMTVRLDGEKAKSLDDFPNLVNALDANANFNITKVLLEKVMEKVMLKRMQSLQADQAEMLKQAQVAAKEQIQGYLQQNLLKAVGDNYNLTAHFKAGKLTVNGQEIPLPF